MTVSLRRRAPLQVWSHLGIWHFTCTASHWPHSGTGFAEAGKAADMARLHLRQELRERAESEASGSA